MKMGLLVAIGLFMTAAAQTGCAPLQEPEASPPLATAAASSAVPRYETGPCPFSAAGLNRAVECGTLVVAEDRAKPAGNQVRIPVAVVKAGQTGTKADPVIFLHGGPGGAVVANVADIVRRTGPGALTADRDWVFFDQRGSGLGLPDLDCGTVQLTDSGLASDADIAAMTACYQRLRGEGVDLSQYNSKVIASDITDLRRALGIGTYNLYGISYGSRVAFAVQQYAPDGLRAVIHDAPYPPESKGTENLPVLVAREVRQVLGLCDADPACAARYGELEPRLTEMAVQWASAPRVVDGRTYTVEDLASWLLDATYGWNSTRSLPRDLAAVMAGRMQVLDDYIEGRSVYEEAQNMAHFCSEELPFESADAMRAKAGADPLALAIVSTAARYFKACEAWDLPPPDPREIQPVRSAVPTLVIASEIDAGCPADAAEATMPNLSAGTFVAVPNATHGISRRSRCVSDMVAGFLADPAKPVERSCIAIEHATLPFILD
ncbi:MAG: alpha/beta hydrolase [Hyphomonadaceae bacterium]|jgi:pimeloyl-ACP methyl ester carboxylesterase|nr:alpha/beta hydrolase [Hyphomonadaceae bacterium]